MGKKKTIWWLVGGLVGLIIVLIILKNAGVIGNTEGVKVAVDTAQDHVIIEVVSASGKIYPETEVKIKPDVSGEIIDMPVEEGDSVTAGQLLLKINPTIYVSEVSQAEAIVNQSRSSVTNSENMANQAKAQMERAEANYNRSKQLYQDKVISKVEYEQAETDYLTAKATYNASLATISGGNLALTALVPASARLVKTCAALQSRRLHRVSSPSCW